MMKKIIVWAVCLFMSCGVMAQGGMRMRVQKPYLQDSLLWLRFKVWNRSAYDFRVGGMAFRVRQRHRLRRTAIQEFRLQPRVRNEPTTIPGDSTAELVYGLAPRVIGKDKELVAELRERNNDRMLRVVISSKTLLHARPLTQHAPAAAKKWAD
jgi:Domain of unknown function (DUF4138)